MQGQSRYAIYFAPQPGNRWWQFGCEWLGRDPISGRTLLQPPVPGIPAAQIAEFTAAPRRYGFHATLKAPFALAEGMSSEDVYRTAALVAERSEPVNLGILLLQNMGHFLGLRPADPPPGLAHIAEDCVRAFDVLRAPAQAAELARRQAGLNARHEALLRRWGYPYVMDEWRFHMTLTRDLSEIESVKLSPWLLSRVRQLNADALCVDAICVFEQTLPAVPFRLTHRFGFDGMTTAYCDERKRGRLFYIVGASGAGKDSLLDYARQRLAGQPLAFAHRYITRGESAGGENHVALSDAEFEARARRGAFALDWASNGHLYGLGVEIDRWLSMGMDVVVNGSRAHLHRARSRYPDLRLIWIEAAPAVLRERLAARGREDGAAIEARLARAAGYIPPRDALIIENNGRIEEAGALLLRELAGSANDAAAMRGG